MEREALTIHLRDILGNNIDAECDPCVESESSGLYGAIGS